MEILPKSYKLSVKEEFNIYKGHITAPNNQLSFQCNMAFDTPNNSTNKHLKINQHQHKKQMTRVFYIAGFIEPTITTHPLLKTNRYNFKQVTFSKLCVVHAW